MTSRRNSLRLQAPPAPPPIPPSLRMSPFLTAPLFTRAHTAAAGPTDAAERWLQDTVPQAASPPGDRRGSITHRPPQHPTAPPHPPAPHSGPLTPAPDASPASPPPSQSRHRYISHSLAPPPDDTHPLVSPLILLPPRPPHPHHPRSAPSTGYFPSVHVS